MVSQKWTFVRQIHGMSHGRKDAPEAWVGIAAGRIEDPVLVDAVAPMQLGRIADCNALRRGLARGGHRNPPSQVKQRGLRGVELMTSDACLGLVEGAGQRCVVVHFYRFYGDKSE